jgi:hypothetical protein
VPEPSLVEVETAIRKLKNYKFPGTDQIPAELIKAGGETLYSEIHKHICCIWNKEELPQQWKESVVRILRTGDKTNNYRGISLLSTAYKIFSNILLARLTSYVSEIIGYRNRSASDQIFYIRQTYLLTSWCRILFERRIVTQLVKKNPAFFMGPEGSLTCSHKAVTGPYPEPAESSSPHRSLSPQSPA